MDSRNGQLTLSTVVLDARTTAGIVMPKAWLLDLSK
jgi:hypothetical protein